MQIEPKRYYILLERRHIHWIAHIELFIGIVGEVYALRFRSALRFHRRRFPSV